MGSDARPNLGFLAACLGISLALACLVATGGGHRPGPLRHLGAGVTEVGVELTPGASAPAAGTAAVKVPGRVVDVPASGDTVLLTASVGATYAVRFQDGGAWGAWVSMSQIDEGPDLAAASGRSQPAGPDGPHAEGPASAVAALGPVRVPDGTARLEVARLSGADDRVTLTFLADLGPTAPTVTAPAASSSTGARASSPSTVTAPATGAGTSGPATSGAATSGSAGSGGAGAAGHSGAAITLPAGFQVPVAAPQPAVMARSTWATEGWATGNAGCGSGPDRADRIQALIVHHTDTTNDYQPGQVPDLLRAIYYAHVHINGWCDIGYNFLVDRFGTIWEGRTGGIDQAVIGSHAKGFNSGTVGVALLGQHQPGVTPAPVRPSADQTSAVRGLAAWKLGLYGVDPNGTTWLKNRSGDGVQKLASDAWHLLPTVMGHRDVGLTSCPGDYGLELARALPGALAAAIPADPPDAYSRFAPYDHGPGFVTVARRGALRPAGSAALPGLGEAGAQTLTGGTPVAVAATGSGTGTAGWALRNDGTVASFGSAATVGGQPGGGATAVDIAAASGAGGWVVTAPGAVQGFGGAADRSVGGTGTVIRGDLNGSGDGYLVTASGHLRPVGNAPDVQASGPSQAVDVAVRGDGASGWILSADGRLHPFGGAPAAVISSPVSAPAGRAYRAVVAASGGQGGWVLSDDGQLWPFGNERLVLPVATDVARADVVDLARTGSVQPSDWLASHPTRFITQAAQVFLGRPPTAGELDHWDGVLTYGGDRFSVTMDLARSDAWAGARIDQFYADVLGRAADPGGRAYWLDQVRAGAGLQELGIDFYGSAEYLARAGSYPAYVQQLYQVLLGRAPEPAGLAYWVGQLDGGARPADVASGFYVSVESRTRRVTQLYQQVLARDPDPGGRDYWVQNLVGTDDVVLAAQLAASDEFYLTAG